MVERAGFEAKLNFKALRTWCVKAVATRSPIEVMTREALQAYLGHRNIQQTVRYSQLGAMFWRRS